MKGIFGRKGLLNNGEQDSRPSLAVNNRILINEISLNHEARTPEGLARNVVLIRELNSNVAKVG